MAFHGSAAFGQRVEEGSTAIWNVLSDMYWRRVKAAQAGELSRPRGDVEELADDLLSVLFQTSGDGEQHIDLGILHAMLAPLPGRGRSVIADFGVLREGQITALSAFVNEQLKLEGDEALPT